MKRPVVSSLDDLAQYIEAVPARLGCWRDGREMQYPLMAWINIQPVVEFRELARELGPHAAAGLQNATHHNQVGIAAGWTTRHMVGPRRSSAATDADRRALFSLAAKYWGLRNLVVEARVGVRGFEVVGNRVRLPYSGNADVDALDRIFDFFEVLDKMDVPHWPASRALREWMAAHAKTTVWEDAPAEVKTEMRQMASHSLDHYERYLDDGIDIGGCTVAEHDAYWRELLARGSYMHGAALQGSTSPEVIAPLLDRAHFVEAMAADAGIDSGAAERVTDLLTSTSSGARMAP